jgi:hypothetical protein
MRDSHDFFHPRRGAQREQLLTPAIAIANDADHGPLLAANQVRFVAALLDALDDMVNVFVRCSTQHVENHFRVLADC